MKTHTIKPNELEAIALAASTEETRYYLNGVYITGGAMVATDGHRLAGLRLDKTGDKDGFILGSADIKKALQLAKLTKKEAGKHVEELVAIVIEGNTIKIMLGEIEKAAFGFKPIDGRFPDYRRVIPANCDDGVAACSFNADYMVDFSKMAKLLSGTKTSHIRLRSTGEGTPIFIDISGAREFTEVLMPVRF